MSDDLHQNGDQDHDKSPPTWKGKKRKVEFAIPSSTIFNLVLYSIFFFNGIFSKWLFNDQDFKPVHFWFRFMIRLKNGCHSAKKSVKMKGYKVNNFSRIFRNCTFRIVMLSDCGLFQILLPLSFGINGGDGGGRRHPQEVKSSAFQFLLWVIWVFIKRPVKPILRQKTRV